MRRPEAVAIDERKLRELVDQALRSASAAGISGKAVTPYLLDQMARMRNGRTLETNIALLVDNARLAARIALAVRAG